MRANRRNFLQKTGLALLTLGLGAEKFSSMTQPYLQALAQSTPRKLALLVGINQYTQGSPLQGCVTDVELQRELLIHRFGYAPSDIVTLTNQQATREGIETAFMEHLTQQVQEGDVVLFHFSGYGSQILDPISSELVNTLVPVDGILPTKGDPALNDILEDTLILLGRSLPTSSVYMVLDTSYQTQEQQWEGNFRLRVCPKLPSTKHPSPEELAFQEQLKVKIKELQSRKILANNIPFLGTVLNAAGGNNNAVEGLWNGFNAGLFTYSLTQFLWEITPASTLYFGLKNITEKMTHERDFPQQPFILRTGKQPQWFYGLLPNKDQTGIGVITAVEEEGKTAVLKLVGLPSNLIDNYNINSLVSLNLPAQKQGILLQIKAKDGLTAKAKIIEAQTLEPFLFKVGQVVRENLRVIARNQALTVALDETLERIEKVDVTSAFANINTINSVINVGEGSADFILGKPSITPPATTVNSAYALKSLSGITWQTVINEPIKLAVQKMVNNFELLLAKKLLTLIENEGTSQLQIEGVLDIIKPKKQLLLKRETGKILSPNIITPHLPQLPLKDTIIPLLTKDYEIQYRFQNHCDRPLYLLLLGFDAQQSLILSTFDPNLENEQENPSWLMPEIASGATLNLPILKINENHPPASHTRLITMQCIFADAPFTNTMKVLNDTNKGGLIPLNNPLNIAKAILQDLHNASKTDAEKVNLTADFYGFHVNHWASFNFIYQV
jgi:hypothetical protein